MFLRCVVVLLFCAFQISKCEKSSLAFVIDDTSSMQAVIDQVIEGANAITDIIVNKRSSQIVDYVLVTFNDPGVNIKTFEDRYKLKHSLRKTHAHDGGDCPEMSLTGIETALKHCRSGSYVYVFTDDAPKEANADVIVERIKSLCQEKQIQIVIILTPYKYCKQYQNTYISRFGYYEDIAASSSGQVYRLNNVHEVTEILKIIEETVNGKRVVDKTVTFPPNQLSNFKFTIDDQTDYAVVSTSGKDVTFTLIKGPTLMYEKKVWTSNVKAVKIIPPGDYVAQVNSGSNTSVVVFKRTDFSFEHGFSEVPTTSLINTSKQSTLDKKSHLLISIFDSSHKIRVISVDILDTKGNVIGSHELKKLSDDFYTTEKFMQPNSNFKIAVNGITATNQPIQRTSKTPISPYIKPIIPEVKFNLQNGIEVPYDSSMSIECLVTAFPPPEVKWLLESNKTEINHAVEEIKYPYVYRNILVLEHVRKSQAFTCKARNGMGEQNEDFVLKVKDPLTVVNIPPEVTKVNYGMSLDLKCLVTSHLPVHIDWMRNTADGKSLQITSSSKYEMSVDKTSLKINNVDLSDKGDYYCKVQLSQLPEMHKEFKTSVDVKTLVPVIKKGENEIRKLNNSDITLTCSILEGLPEPTLKWYFTNRNGIKTLLSQSNILDISKATLKNAGDYTCVAENVAGKDDFTVHLLIEETPKLEKSISNVAVMENASAEILCKSLEGVPEPKITCEFKSIGSQDYQKIDCNQIQHITSVNTKNEGEYKCTAINEVGEDSHNIVLNVNVPPQIDKSVNNLTKHEETELQLNCRILRGNPKPQVILSFTNQDGVITKFDTDSLTISNLDLIHAGRYTCIAENIAGRDTHSVSLTVEAKPRIINKVTTYEAVLHDTVLKVPCMAVGHPTPSIMWTQVNQTPIVNNDFMYVDNEVLVIKDLSYPRDTKYYCRAMNEFGFDRKMFHVSITSNNNYNESDSNEVHILLGSSTQLNCSKLDGDHTYRWYKNGVFDRVGPYYNIIDAASRDSANYTCRIDNNGVDNAENERNIVLYVGWPPEFEENRNATIEFDGSMISLSCSVRSKTEPSPTFIWTKNGVTLNAIRSELIVNDWGNYKCHAHNVHGSIEKSFKVKSDNLCLIERKANFIINVPLILHDNTTLAVLKAREHFLLLESGTEIKFSCPNENMFSSEKLNGKKLLDAKCDREDKFIIEGQSYKFSELNCKDEVQSQIIKTGVKCMENSEVFKVGFKDSGFVEVFEACKETETNNVLYTKHQLINPYYDDSDEVDPFDNLYINQLNQLQTSSCHLVNAEDVTYGPAQKAANAITFNNVLCSKSKNNVTWNDAEEIVRKIIKDNYDVPKLTVWTGAKHYNTNDEITPQYLWKVVENGKSREKIAIVYNNQEDVEDLCEKISQFDLPTWIDYPAYPIYPCTLSNFSRNVGIPVKVFS